MLGHTSSLALGRTHLHRCLPRSCLQAPRAALRPLQAPQLARITAKFSRRRQHVQRQRLSLIRAGGHNGSSTDGQVTKHSLDGVSGQLGMHGCVGRADSNRS